MNILAPLFVLICVLSSFASANSDTCGKLLQIVLEPANPPGTRLQVTILDRVTKKRERMMVSEELRSMPETNSVLQLAMQNEKLDFCMSKANLGISKR